MEQRSSWPQNQCAQPLRHHTLSAAVLMQDYLLKWPKTLLVVSHARDFLNSVCTDILHLHHFKLTTYRGNYDVFEKTAAERHRNAKKAAEGQERQKKHMQVRPLWSRCRATMTVWPRRANTPMAECCGRGWMFEDLEGQACKFAPA